jgi:hypothetical protein
MYQVICMSFDGEYQREKAEFKTIEEAGDYLGSKWYFYPFHFIVSKNTIREVPEGLEDLKGKRIKTVSKIFNELSLREEMKDAGVEDFFYALTFNRD